MEYPKFKVGVRCFTFNHSKYITDALNGFVMQQTDFPYVCCIVDDASTDGEQEVIRKYVSDNFDLSEGSCHFERETDYAFITYAQHKTNKNCYFAVLYLKENHYSIKKPKMPYLAEWQDGCEYHALCEGDDYWIHPGKLQMQAEFLDGHKDYSMCFHNARVHWEDGRAPDYQFATLSEKDYNGVEIYSKWIVPTASVLLRREVYNSAIYSEVKKNKKFVFGDTPLFVSCAEIGKVRCINEIMSVYRRIEGSAVFQQSSNYSKIKARAYHMLEFGNVFGERYKKEAESDFLSDCVYCFLHSIKTPKDKIQWWGLTEAVKISILGTCQAFFGLIDSRYKNMNESKH